MKDLTERVAFPTSTPYSGGAHAINDAGQVVGTLNGRAFLYENGVITDLGNLGYNSAIAYDINDHGVIVGQSHITPGTEAAFIYVNGRMTNLETLIDPQSGWLLDRAEAINNAGQIVAWGYRPGTGGFPAHALLLSPINPPPQADPGGPYAIEEGQPLTLDGSESVDPTGQGLTYDWDVNGDGTFGDASGVNATLSWSQLQSLGIAEGGPGAGTSYTVTLRVRAGQSTAGESTALVVTNAAPTIASLTTNAAAVGAVSEGRLVTLSGVFSDPGVLDTHTATIDWGDGSTTIGTVDELAHTAAGSHAYAAGGLYTMKLTVSDDDGGSVSRTTTGYVSGSGVHNGVLEVIATAGNDRVDVLPKDGKVRVGSGFLPGYYRFYDPAQISRVFIATGAGDDKMNVWDTVNAWNVFDGGPGNDELWAGQRTLLIGGTGADRINGANGDDIAVASPTAIDTDLPALLAVLNGTRQLLASEMPNDGAADVLCGNKGVDSFYGNFRGDGVIDTISDVYMRPEEQQFDIL